MATTIAAPALEINAPLQTVWEILDDFERYPEWNPLTVHVHTSKLVGTPVILDVRMGDSFRQVQKEKLIAYQPPYKLAWGEYLPRFILSATRWQVLEVLDAQRTSYQTHETFSGPLEWLTMRLYQRIIEQGLTEMSQALKRRAESLRQP
jgi:hypothetical protein